MNLEDNQVEKSSEDVHVEITPHLVFQCIQTGQGRKYPRIWMPLIELASILVFSSVLVLKVKHFLPN